MLWKKSSEDLGEQNQDTERHKAFELINCMENMSLYMESEALILQEVHKMTK